MKGMRTTRPHRLILLTTAAVAAMVLVSGCGGGGSSSGSSSGGEVSSSFVTGADKACGNANEQIAALGTPQQDEVLGYLEKTEVLIEELHEEVQALVGSGTAETEYVEALGKSVIVLNHMSNAARNENFDAVRELSDQLIEYRVGELAEAAELTVCAEVPGVEES
ncbi:MAG TPA: hypothetical protein VIJ21_00805 [Solirubrobacterales bacterium]